MTYFVPITNTSLPNHTVTFACRLMYVVVTPWGRLELILGQTIPKRRLIRIRWRRR